MVMAGLCKEPKIDSNGIGNRLPLWLKWNRTSADLLCNAEKRLLSRVKSKLESFFVPIFNETCFIRTVIAESANDNKNSISLSDSPLPIVLVHGFASGSALWCKNIDAFSYHRQVFMFDLLGFGRSSRPTFSYDATEVEEKWVESLEEWRAKLKLEKFILLGHSLGGYIASSYAMSHPERVAHLILADPWGFTEGPPQTKNMANVTSAQAWMFSFVRHFFRPFNPLWFLRAAGPLGPKLIHHFRQDLRAFFDQRPIQSGEILEIPSKTDEMVAKEGASHPIQTADSDNIVSEFESSNKNVYSGDVASNSKSATAPIGLDELDGSVALDYVYHINAQHPSGEVGFKSLCSSVGWPQHPMLDRIGLLDKNVPITFIYGSRSWMDMSSGLKTRLIRFDSYVDVKIIEGAGHQVYAQTSDEFNSYVNLVCERVDNNDPFNPTKELINTSHSDDFKLNYSNKEQLSNRPKHRRVSIATSYRSSLQTIKESNFNNSTKHTNHYQRKVKAGKESFLNKN